MTPSATSIARYPSQVRFRDRLLATLRAVEPVLQVPGVLVAGSEVPNLLEPGAAATLVVSQNVDLAIPVSAHADVVACLDEIEQLIPSQAEPSVWTPRATAGELIEVNFIGLDPAIVDPMDTYERADARLPLMVFGPLSLLAPGTIVEIDGLRVPLPRPSGLALEKLVTDRTGEKGARDLLVVAGLLATMSNRDLDQLVADDARLPAELRHQVRSSLSILSLMAPVAAMPDPTAQRAVVHALLGRLEPL